MEREYEMRKLEAQEARIKETRAQLERVKSSSLKDQARRTESDSFNDRREVKPQNPADEPQQNGLKKNDTYDPWGKGVGHPRRDPKGNTCRFKFSRKNHGVNFVDNNRETMSLDLANDPRQFPMSPRRGMTSRTAPHYQSQDYEDNVGKPTPRFKKPNTEKLEIYDPFGKSGGGAPNKDFHGRVRAKVFGQIEHEYNARNAVQKVKAARQYLNELQDEMEEQKRQRDYQDKQMKEPMGELAPIVQDKMVGKPRRDPRTGLLLNHHLGTSDVTKLKMNYQPKTNYEKLIYHEDLAEQAEKRQRRKELDGLKHNQEGVQHYATMDDYWGRPGGGAPKGAPTQLKKANLENILFQPKTDFNPSADQYIRSKDWSQQQIKERDPEYYFEKENKPIRRVQLYENRDKDNYPKVEPQKYIRSTVGSKSTNLYEYNEEQVLTQKNFKVDAPYAMHTF